MHGDRQAEQPEPADADEAAFVHQIVAYPRTRAWLGLDERHELTRFVLLRLLGFVYVAAFVSLLWQVLPLIGARGLTPALSYTARVLVRNGLTGRCTVCRAEPVLVRCADAMACWLASPRSAWCSRWRCCLA